MPKRIETVAIIGGGPAGATLGALLAKDGYKTAIFQTDKRPPLIVGESLLPAVIPYLRKLGIEDEIKSFSIYKPGATVCLSLNEVISASFTFADGRLPDYAYNTPRDLFDQSVMNAARNAGAAIFPFSAKLEGGEGPDSVRLAAETLEKTAGFFGAGPDLIVDASGRLRLISRLLETPIKEGGRHDVALFAHLNGVMLNDAGHIHLDRLTKGWSWRIPLPGRVSLGIVIHPDHLKQYGNGIEEQFDGFLREEPSLRAYAKDSTRISPVIKYNNYQIIPERMYGPGWAVVGDSAGFVDPVFSSGLYLGMKGAYELFKAIRAGSDLAMQRYERGRKVELKKWQGVIDSWYDGRLFNLYRAGQKYKDNPIGARMALRVRKRLARILTGEAVDDGFNMKLFEYLISFGAVMRDPKDLVVM